MKSDKLWYYNVCYLKEEEKNQIRKNIYIYPEKKMKSLKNGEVSGVPFLNF